MVDASRFHTEGNRAVMEADDLRRPILSCYIRERYGGVRLTRAAEFTRRCRAGTPMVYCPRVSDLRRNTGNPGRVEATEDSGEPRDLRSPTAPLLVLAEG